MAHRTFNPRLPVYRSSDVDGALREGRVASLNELRARRLQPAEGQEPVGQYWSGYRWAPVYRSSDCVPMKPLTPAQQARWDWHRTCHRCGETRRDPWDKDWRFWVPGSGVWSGRPSCCPCKRVEDQVQWIARANRDRAAASAYAHGLLADPTLTVLIEERIRSSSAGTQDALRVTAVDDAGSVLLDDTVHYVCEYTGRDSVWEQGRPVAEIADQVRQLAGRRLVAWLPAYSWQRGLLEGTVLHALGEDLALTVAAAEPIYDCDVDPGRPDPLEHVGTRFGGAVNVLTAHWLGKPKYPGRWDVWQYDTPESLADAARQVALVDDPGDEPAAQAECLLELIAVISVGAHPAGPARCPQRDGRDGDECGRTDVDASTGMCADHTPTDKPSATPGGTS